MGPATVDIVMLVYQRVLRLHFWQQKILIADAHRSLSVPVKRGEPLDPERFNFVVRFIQVWVQVTLIYHSL